MRCGGRLPLALLASLCRPAPAEREFAEDLRVSMLQRSVRGEQLLERGEESGSTNLSDLRDLRSSFQGSPQPTPDEEANSKRGEEEIPEMKWAVHDRSGERSDYPVRSKLNEERRGRSDDLYRGVGEVLERFNKEGLDNSSHSKHIMRFIMEKDFAPALARGCLFLPNDQAWKAFYGHLERPYPPIFAQMIANSFYPDCGNVSLSGLTLEFCDAERRSVRVESGCLASGVVGRAVPRGKAAAGLAEDEAETHGLEVFLLGGHVGLPDKWLHHLERSHRSLRGEEPGGAARASLLQRRRVQRQRRWTDACADNTDNLRCVPTSKKLVIPIRFVVCYITTPGVDDTMIEDQVEWLTYSYRGNQFPAEEPFSNSRYGADMQIEFELVRRANGSAAYYVQDSDCAQWAFYDTALADQYNTDDPERYFTVVIISNDASGILGLATLPQSVQETSSSLLMIVSLYGFKNWALLNDFSLMYNEGDTMVHEGGHMFGLYHTFQGGCSMQGDLVWDTHREWMPMYTCEALESPCPSGDGSLSFNPVHNFMDYADDRCMSMFTIGQTRRAWCVLHTYRPTLYNLSLRDMAGDLQMDKNSGDGGSVHEGPVPEDNNTGDGADEGGSRRIGRHPSDFRLQSFALLLAVIRTWRSQ